MTALSRFQVPSGEFKTLNSQLNRFFEPFFRPYSFVDEDVMTGTWNPAVDVAEERDRLVVRAEIPGMRKEDIQIEFTDGVLSIRGERQFEKTSDERNYHRIERSYGSFVRSFTIPRVADPEKITAEYRDGILEISVPKREDAKPRQIQIAAD